jgi:hypothetical protein
MRSALRPFVIALGVSICFFRQVIGALGKRYDDGLDWWRRIRLLARPPVRPQTTRRQMWTQRAT